MIVLFGFFVCLLVLISLFFYRVLLMIEAEKIKLFHCSGINMALKSYNVILKSCYESPL